MKYNIKKITIISDSGHYENRNFEVGINGIEAITDISPDGFRLYQIWKDPICVFKEIINCPVVIEYYQRGDCDEK